jgi:hypothetical protein
LAQDLPDPSPVGDRRDIKAREREDLREHLTIGGVVLDQEHRGHDDERLG